MALIASMTFDDEDPDVHAHFTAHAHDLDQHDPPEWGRVLVVLEQALRDYADRVARARAMVTTRADEAVPDAPS